MNKQDATIYLKGIKDFYGLDKDSEEAIDVAIEALSAERTGDWVVNYKERDEIYVHPVRCSKCGVESLLEWEEHTDYCPVCGSRNYNDKGGDTE